MKTVILMRHSKPQKSTGLPNGQIPLSDEGVRLAKVLISHPAFTGVRHIWSSPYRRALETAEVLGLPTRTDLRLRERDLGDPATLDADFWGHQYRDLHFRNRGGESLKDAQLRMTAFMNELLYAMQEGEKAVVVSHAAAICAYLLNFCSIAVLDEEKKGRQIKFGTEPVLNGPMATPGAFLLTFQGRSLVELSYFEH